MQVGVEHACRFPGRADTFAGRRTATGHWRGPVAPAVTTLPGQTMCCRQRPGPGLILPRRTPGGRPVSGTGRSCLAFVLAAAPDRPAGDARRLLAGSVRQALAARAADLQASPALTRRA